MNSQSESKQLRRFTLLTVFFITVKLLLHLFTNTRYELLRDEMLFFNMGEHLSAGYATVPPLTGLLAWFINTVFGFSVAGIRIVPALMGAASLWFISRIVKELGGGITALVIASVSYLLAPGFLIVSTLFTPNAPEELIWLILTWLFIRMVRTQNPVYWVPAGIVAAVGFLNKYSIVFPAGAFIISLYFTVNRHLFFSRYFFAALISGLIIISPNIIWQYNHGWPVMIHMSELKSSQLDLMSYLDFPVSLFSFCQGAALISIIGLFALLFSQKEKEFRFLGIASLMILIALTVLKGKGYYALGLIPFLLAFGGYFIEKYFTGGLRYVKTFIVRVSFLMSVAAIPSGLPVLSYANYEKYISLTKNFIVQPLLKWDNGTEMGFSQAWADMTGWEELAGYVAKAFYTLSPEERETCTIFGERNYGYAGAVYFYGRQHNLPEAVTFHESYTFWAPDSIPGGPIIYIYRDINNLNDLFSDIEEVGSVGNPWFREKGLKVFVCRSPKQDIRKIYAELAAAEKSRFRRSES